MFHIVCRDAKGWQKQGQASPTQPKLTDYRVHSEAKQANEDNMAAVAAEEAEEASGEGELFRERRSTDCFKLYEK